MKRCESAFILTLQTSGDSEGVLCINRDMCLKIVYGKAISFMKFKIAKMCGYPGEHRKPEKWKKRQRSSRLLEKKKNIVSLCSTLETVKSCKTHKRHG